MKINKFELTLLKIKNRLNFKNQSLMVKFSFVLFIVFLTIILFSYLTFIKYKNDKQSSTIAVIESMNSQIMDKIDNQINELSNITKLPITFENKDNSFLRRLDQANINNFDDFDFSKQLNRFFNHIISFRLDIQSVLIYNLKGRFMSTTNMSKDYCPLNEDWFNETLKKNGSPIAIGTYYLNTTGNVSDANKYVFSVSRAIVNPDNYNAIAVIMINTNLNFFSKLLKQSIFIPGQRIVVVDTKGNIMFDTIESNILKELEPKYLDLVFNSINTTKSVILDNDSFLTSYYTSDLTGWKVLNIIPENELYKPIYETRTTLGLIAIMLYLIASLLIFLISLQISKPIKKLILLMKIVEKGDFDVRLKLTNHNEIGELCKTFNKMTRRVNKLINEVYIEKIRQKDLELQMLQNQINPHFLYNTLESIHMIAETNRDGKISMMAQALGRILRYSISMKQDKVTVQDEIDHLMDYIALQKVRFNSLFNITVNIDESLYKNLIIKMILQPIVENSIYHGLENKIEGGKIDISGYKENSFLIFEIIDNGTGMDQTQLINLNDYINGYNNFYKSIGLKNVNKRIKLYYGAEYGIKIFSTMGEGTIVKVILPCNEQV